METLSIEDLQKLNQSIQKLYTLHDLETFGVTALSIVDRLVPSDFPLFHLTNARTGQICLTYLPSYPTYRVYTSQFRIKKTWKVGEKMDNPILIHADLIDSQAFGDPRLVKRGRRYTQQSANIRQ
jgi:hypothetical protein